MTTEKIVLVCTRDDDALQMSITVNLMDFEIVKREYKWT